MSYIWNPAMKRFDDSKDVVLRLAWHWNQKSGSGIHPRMNKVEMSKAIM